MSNIGSIHSRQTPAPTTTPKKTEQHADLSERADEAASIERMPHDQALKGSDAGIQQPQKRSLLLSPFARSLQPAQTPHPGFDALALEEGPTEIAQGEEVALEAEDDMPPECEDIVWEEVPSSELAQDVPNNEVVRFEFDNRAFDLGEAWLTKLGMSTEDATSSPEENGLFETDWQKFPEGAVLALEPVNSARLASLMFGRVAKLERRMGARRFIAPNSPCNLLTVYMLDAAQKNRATLFSQFFIASHAPDFDGASYYLPAKELIKFSGKQGMLTPDALGELVAAVAGEIVKPAAQSSVKRKVDLLDATGDIVRYHVNLKGWNADPFKVAMKDLFKTILTNYAASPEAERDTAGVWGCKLGVAAGLGLAGSFKAAGTIKSSDELKKKVLTTGKDVTFALAGLNHPVVATALGIIGPVVGFSIDQFIKPRDHSKIVRKMESHLALAVHGFEEDTMLPMAQAFWNESRRRDFIEMIAATLQANGVR